MAIDVGAAVVGAVVREATKRVFPYITGTAEKPKEGAGVSLENALARHVKIAASWSSQYNFLGMSVPKDSRTETIPLRLSDVPRRYRGSDSDEAHELGEDAFLKSPDPAVLLGDPGAGKTTTLKRLCLRLLSEEQTADELDYQLPIVVVLRDLGTNRSLIPYLAGVFGESAIHTEGEEKGGREYIINGADALERIGDMLDLTKAVLIVDGLDELSPERRPLVERELEVLSAYTRCSKIIVSCRSGDYNRPLHSFHTFELLPLSRSEVIDIAKAWLGDPAEFIRHLESKPYHDVIDRPLLLSFLLFLFKSEGQLPQRPSLIYRKVVYRLLKDWDDERRIKRGSAYANFDPDVKIDFLSEFSYLLTYRLKSRGFTDADAMEILAEIGTSYSLPQTQFTEVLREIETHTGIVVSAGFNRFEFAHLSVQEFLCASFIARSPIPELLKSYLSEYPAPVAVACALSSQPDLFLYQMLRRHLLDKFRNQEDVFYALSDDDQLAFDLFGADTSNTLFSFLSRLQLETPAFRPSREFGEAILLIYAFYYRRYSKRIDEAIDTFAGTPVAREAVARRLEGNDWEAYSLTRTTAGLSIQEIFIELYEQIAGRWPKNDRKAQILPVALLPKDLIKEVDMPLVTAEEGEAALEDIKRNISGTPFCLIEFGRHRRRSTGGACDVCGNRPAEKYRSDQKKKKRSGRGQARM